MHFTREYVITDSNTIMRAANDEQKFSVLRLKSIHLTKFCFSRWRVQESATTPMCRFLHAAKVTIVKFNSHNFN